MISSRHIVATQDLWRHIDVDCLNLNKSLPLLRQKDRALQEKRPETGRLDRVHQSNVRRARKLYGKREGGKEVVKRNVLSATLTFFGRRLGLVTNEGAMIILFAVQSIHYFMPF